MGVEMSTDIGEVDMYFEEESRDIDTDAIELLSRLGDGCLKESREKSQIDTFIDHSGDLRSSIGCAIAHNGNIVKILGFDVVLNGHNGAAKGKALAIEIAKQHSDEYVLAVVAGEDYAVFVEALENKAVITDAELFVVQELPSLLNQLSSKR